MNLARLDRRFPEYGADIQAYQRRDDLRVARWAIDAFRLRRGTGRRFVLVLRNWLAGGTGKAIDDIAAVVGYGDAVPLDLAVDINGISTLSCAAPQVAARFAPDEHAALFGMLATLPVEAVLIHQLLGHTDGFVRALMDWSRGRRSFYYLHDYYPLCPRVTMIDAGGVFCDVAPVAVCARCVDLAGTHDADRLEGGDVAAHRTLFAGMLAGVDRVLVPSASAGQYLARGFPHLPWTVLPHPEPASLYAVPMARGTGWGVDVVLFGAIGPHKGSGKLLEVAQRARLVAPELRFHVVGYTDLDDALLECGNVSISGRYLQEELPRLVRATGARLALFLSGFLVDQPPLVNAASCATITARCASLCTKVPGTAGGSSA